MNTQKCQQHKTGSVTVAMATYRRPKFMRQALQSILDQDIADLQILIGNNDPENNLLANELPEAVRGRVSIFNHTTNLGAIGNMNFLLAKANTEFFTWLADDDLMMPGFLKTALNFLQQQEDCTVVFGDFFQQFSWDGKEYLEPMKAMRHEGSNFLGEYLERKIQAIGNYGLYRLEFLKKIGGMPELDGQSSPPGCDNLMVIHSGVQGPIGYIPQKTHLFRKHEGSPSQGGEDYRSLRSAYSVCTSCAKEAMEYHLDQDLAATLLVSLIRWCNRFFFLVVRRNGIFDPREVGRFLQDLWQMNAKDKEWAVIEKEVNHELRQCAQTCSIGLLYRGDEFSWSTWSVMIRFLWYRWKR